MCKIDLTHAQFIMLTRVGQGSESFFYFQTPALTDIEDARRRLHQELERLGLIERSYVDPHDAAHRLSVSDAAAADFEIEIYLRWKRRWFLTDSGKSSLRAREWTCSGATRAECRIENAAQGYDRSAMKLAFVQFSPNETSIIMRFADQAGTVDRTSDDLTVRVSVTRNESRFETLRRARSMIRRMTRR